MKLLWVSMGIAGRRGAARPAERGGYSRTGQKACTIGAWLLSEVATQGQVRERDEDATMVVMMGSDTSVMTESQGSGEPLKGTPAAEFCGRGEYSGRKPTSSAGGVLEKRAVVERV